MRTQTCLILLISTLVLLVLQGCSCLFVGEDKTKCLECKAIETEFLRDMDHEPFYYKDDNACKLVKNPDETDEQEFYSDAGCQNPFPYYAQGYTTYCRNNLLNDDRTRLHIGNPDSWTHLDTSSSFRETKWTLSMGARINIMVPDQTKKTRPFLKKVNFRKADHCDLEMNILKNQANGRNLKPILFFFGGGWKAWGPGAPLSIEITGTNLTDKGYIVFAAYYRLLDHQDARPECNRADGKKMLEDIIAAKDWVYKYGQNYGMSAQYGKEPGKKKLSVYGQSAGGHLAGFLATNFPQEINKAVLMYPATDFKFFIDQSKSKGLYKDSYNDVKPLVVKFVNQPGVSKVTQIDTGLSLVESNSFPTLINPNPGSYPDYFMVQGSSDEIAPTQMTTRMCQALNPNQSPTNDPYKTCHSVQSCTTTENCGNNSQLRIIGKAGHTLELRCFNETLGKIINKLYHTDVVCAPGTYEGETMVEDTINEILDDFLD